MGRTLSISRTKPLNIFSGGTGELSSTWVVWIPMISVEIEDKKRDLRTVVVGDEKRLVRRNERTEASVFIVKISVYADVNDESETSRFILILKFLFRIIIQMNNILYWFKNRSKLI